MEGITIHKTTALMAAGLILAMMLAGYIVFSAPEANASPGAAGTGSNGSLGGGGSGAQDIYIRALSSGSYDRQEVTVKAGIPVRLHFTADPDAGCGRQLVIYGLNVKAVSRSGEEDVVDFTPPAGTYEYNCGMRMWRPGRLVVQ